MIAQRLQQALKDADTSAGNMDIDQIAWLIGSFPDNSGARLRDLCTECPRITALLPEMTACGSDAQALLRISQYMNNEDTVGNVADLIRRFLGR